MNPTEDARALLRFGTQRMLDLSDWMSRHPIPQDWSINLTLHPKTPEGHQALTLRIAFPSYREAAQWAHQHCSFLNQDKGYAAAVTFEMFMSIPMSDFTLTLAFPEHTHPRFFPALNGTTV